MLRPCKHDGETDWLIDWLTSKRWQMITLVQNQPIRWCTLYRYKMMYDPSHKQVVFKKMHQLIKHWVWINKYYLMIILMAHWLIDWWMYNHNGMQTIAAPKYQAIQHRPKPEPKYKHTSFDLGFHGWVYIGSWDAFWYGTPIFFLFHGLGEGVT